MHNSLIDTSHDIYFTERGPHTIITHADLTTTDNKTSNSANILDKIIKLIAVKNTGAIKEMLEKDKNTKIIPNVSDSDSENLLHYSIFADSYEITRLFLKYGLDPNRRDKQGQTPIFRIIFSHNDKIIGLLLEYGALISMQDNDGNTPLHLAVLAKNHKIVEALLKYGADPYAHNKNNFIPLDFALNKTDNLIVLDEKTVEIFSHYTN